MLNKFWTFVQGARLYYKAQEFVSLASRPWRPWKLQPYHKVIRMHHKLLKRRPGSVTFSSSMVIAYAVREACSIEITRAKQRPKAATRLRSQSNSSVDVRCLERLHSTKVYFVSEICFVADYFDSSHLRLPEFLQLVIGIGTYVFVRCSIPRLSYCRKHAVLLSRQVANTAWQLRAKCWRLLDGTYCASQSYSIWSYKPF